MTGTSEILCQGTLGQMFYGRASVHLLCALRWRPFWKRLPAALVESLKRDLGFSGIQLFLICNNARTPNGMCDPSNSCGRKQSMLLGILLHRWKLCRSKLDDSRHFLLYCGHCMWRNTGTTDAPSAVDPAPTLAPTPTTAIVDPELLPTMEPTFEGTVDSFEPTFADPAVVLARGPLRQRSNGADFISGSMRSNKVTAVSMLSCWRPPLCRFLFLKSTLQGDCKNVCRSYILDAGSNLHIESSHFRLICEEVYGKVAHLRSNHFKNIIDRGVFSLFQSNLTPDASRSTVGRAKRGCFSIHHRLPIPFHLFESETQMNSMLGITRV